MAIPSLSGSRYLLTFIDDTSRYAEVYFLKNKSDTFGTFRNYRTMIEKQLGRKIKVLRSDGGGEYVNREMQEYLTKNGIRCETTVADTPQQNGVSERYNRTLLETVRALMHSAGIPTNLWAELSATAAYLRNRLPSRANIKNKSPYELWNNKKPNVEHLRVIWSDAYAHVPKQKRTKLELRATKLKLIGYHNEKKAYKLWNAVTGHVEVSRDVIFDETSVLHHPPIVQEPSEYIVEMIIDERSTEDNKVEYLVKWVGYDDDTWEPRENVEDTEALEKWEQRHLEANVAKLPDDNFLAIDVDANIADTCDEPKTYNDAITSSEAYHWREAIRKELESIEKAGTWRYVDRNQVPLEKKPIGSRWVFKRKLNQDGTIERYKARLVAKGYAQQPGIDYNETYAPVAKLTTIRLLLSIAAILDLEIHQMDVKTAFLNGTLSEEIYMTIPDGINITGNKLCQLIRSLYGLKQSSRCWYQKLSTFLTDQGFTRIQSDYAVFVKRTGISLIIIGIHVDDLMILGSTKKIIAEVKEILSSTFEMTDCGEIHFYLGIQVKRDRKHRRIMLNQSAFAEQVISRFRMQDANPLWTCLSSLRRLPTTISPTRLSRHISDK